MNKATYDKYRLIEQNFDKKFTMELDIKNIEVDLYNSQIRQKGHATAKIPAMRQSILSEGQQVPITVRKLSNGNYELKDGFTRFQALKELGKTKVFCSDYFDKEKSPNSDEWYDHQCEQNDHPVTTPNSAADIGHQIQERVKNGFFERLVGHKYEDDPEDFINKSTEHLKSVYKNSGIGTNKLRNMLKKSLTGVISTMYEAYTKATAMDKIKALNTHGWTTSKSKTQESIGEICNNTCFYLAASQSQLTTNALANVAWKKIGNPSVKMYIVCYVGDLAGKDDEKVLAAREKYSEDYNKINDAYGIFSGLYFMPQFKTGKNKENMYHMIEG